MRRRSQTPITAQGAWVWVRLSMVTGSRLTPLPLRVVVVFFVVCFIQVQGFECKVRKANH